MEYSLADLPTLRMGDHGGHVTGNLGYLRLRNLPVDEHGSTVLLVKLEFDGPPIP